MKKNCENCKHLVFNKRQDPEYECVGRVYGKTGLSPHDEKLTHLSQLTIKDYRLRVKKCCELKEIKT